MADLAKDTSKIETKHIGQEIDQMVQLVDGQRKNYARHWYDNNFFDDGYHFRFISRTTGRIVDLSEKETLFAPKRAIPKASRQIRGMANLMLSSEFQPLVLPEKVSPYSYEGGYNSQEFHMAYQQSKKTAKRSGQWIESEWDEQDLDLKLALMVILSMKNCISYLQVWPDAEKEKVNTQVYDAFDIYLLGNRTEIYDSPFIGKIVPKLISEIKANPAFDKNQLEKIAADNRYASDEIKEAYLSSQFGKSKNPSDASATLLQKEFFLKEHLTSDNKEAIMGQENGGEILKDKEKGDIVLRQVFSAGGVWLYDKYVGLPDYPFVDFRMEPGQIYQIPQIERFISQNKSLDSIVSRIERYLHTMNVGVWLKRKGENFELSNASGGLLAEYEGTPPAQMPLAGLPGSTFTFVDMLNSFIEEQGVTTSALGKLPKGVKAWGAIESLKSSEFANLYIPIKQLKKTMRLICEKMLDIADKHFITPQTVMRLDKGEPDYFDVIGQAGVQAREKAKMELPPDIVPIKKDYKVKIEIVNGMGYTEEGKKQRMMELANFMLAVAQTGMIDPQALKLVIQRLMEQFQFGSTEEMMEALEAVPQQMPQQFSQDQVGQVKIAMLEVIKDIKNAQEGQNAGSTTQEAGSAGGQVMV